jgi:hypothetical protein
MPTQSFEYFVQDNDIISEGDKYNPKKIQIYLKCVNKTVILDLPKMFTVPNKIVFEIEVEQLIPYPIIKEKTKKFRTNIHSKLFEHIKSSRRIPDKYEIDNRSKFYNYNYMEPSFEDKIINAYSMGKLGEIDYKLCVHCGEEGHLKIGCNKDGCNFGYGF